MRIFKSERGVYIKQTATVMLVGAVTAVGVVYFLGYVDRAKSGAAFEQIQALYMATLLEANKTNGADKTIIDFVRNNSLPIKDWSNIDAVGSFELASGDSVVIAPSGGDQNDDTSALFLMFSPNKENREADAQLIARALNAGYIIPAASSTDMIGMDPTAGTLPSGIAYMPGKGYLVSKLKNIPYYFVIKGASGIKQVDL